MAERLFIDGAVLAQEIVALSQARSQAVVNSAAHLRSQGKTARVAGLLADLFIDLDHALNALIDQTQAFLVNVQDTFVNVDAEAAAAAVRLEDELAG
ncbi:MAG: hypothetical protein LBK42_02835 [Propionibacteriaceae bacterium]|jgi:hypothetical protein|nr:hypothetical protein [Propionibacteriaceae bacterium]